MTVARQMEQSITQDFLDSFAECLYPKQETDRAQRWRCSHLIIENSRESVTIDFRKLNGMYLTVSLCLECHLQLRKALG